MVTVKSKQSFRECVISGEDEIRVENPELAKWVVAAHAIKQVAWAAAIVLVSAGIYSLLATGGASGSASAALVGLTAGIVGFSGATAMVGLAITLGGIAGLKSIRSNYRISEKGNGYVVLQRK